MSTGKSSSRRIRPALTVWFPANPNHNAASRSAYRGWTNLQVAVRFGVSEQMAQRAMVGPRAAAKHAAARRMRSG